MCFGLLGFHGMAEFDNKTCTRLEVQEGHEANTRVEPRLTLRHPELHAVAEPELQVVSPKSSSLSLFFNSDSVWTVSTPPGFRF